AHDGGQFLLDPGERPGRAARVLAHLQGAHRHTAGVGGLPGPERDVGLLEDLHGVRRRRHVRALRHRLHPVADEGQRGAGVQLVLRRGRQRYVGGHGPHAAAGHEPRRRAAQLGVVGDAAAVDLLDVLEEVEVDALLVDDVTAGVRHGDHVRAELLGLLHRVDRDVTRTGHHDLLPVEVLAAAPQHLRREHDVAVAGRLRAARGSAPQLALPGAHARPPPVGDAAVLAVQVTDLAGSDADVTGGDVGVLADVAVQLGHERLAEPHDLLVGAAVRVEVAPALAAAYAEAGQRVLEDLLETEELDDAEVHRGVEAQPALVGAERAVVLHAETAVDVNPALVVLPGHTENDLTFRLYQALHQLCGGQAGARRQSRPGGFEYLVHGLVELRLARITPQHPFVGLL